ncbi:hypothetical protein SLS60_001410 [Paraconiothyrium brasiliense]|uniref:REase associating with pPIWI RE domain-containing protein n=1 Tax=Paraconiothyrium brasiliense TaxID=300254 RepID=A0ABR3S900_9PLEO
MELRSKRKLGAITPFNRSVQAGQPSKRRKTGSAKNVGGTSDGRYPQLSLLGLPAEVRNRIYHFAIDDYIVNTVQFLDGDEDALDPEAIPETLMPRLTKYAPWSKAKPAKPHYPFFGLSQVCRQIRAEYRPLWLSSSSFTIKYQDLEALVGAFFPEYEQQDGDSQAAVGLGRLIIDWEDSENANQLLPLLRFAHHYPNTDISWCSILFQTPTWFKTKCTECGHRGSGVRKPLCEHKLDRLEDWRVIWPDMHDRYLTLVQALISHNNESWKSDIRTGFIERVNVPVWREPDLLHENQYDHLLVDLKLSRKNGSSWMPPEQFHGHETCLFRPGGCDVRKDYLEGIDLPVTESDTVYLTI